MPVLWLAVLLFFAMTSPSPAAGPAPSSGVTYSGTYVYADNLTVAADPTGGQSIADAMRVGQAFQPAHPFAAVRAYPYRYWLRFAVTNASVRETTLQLSPDTWDDVDMWVVRAGRVPPEPLQRSGVLVPIQNPEQLYPSVTLGARERVTVYAHVGWSGRFSRPRFRIGIATLAGALQKAQFRLWGDGMILGSLLALAIYGLVIFISTKDTSYAWYPIYLLALALSFAGQFGPGPSHLARWVTPDRPYASEIIKRIADPLAWFALVQFARSFFRTSATMRRWDRALLGMAIAIPVISGAYVFVPDLNAWQLWLWDAAAAMCLVTSILAAMRGLRATYFLIGQALVAFGSFASSMAIAGYPIFTFLGNSGFRDYFQGTKVVFLFAVFDALIFSFALADRFRRIEDAAAAADREHQRERTQLMQEQNERLERTVAERTNELRAERDTSDRLLANILPASVAEELKRDGSSLPSRFDEASILFTDFKDFTTISGLMPPKKVVDELDEIFRAFDDIIDANGLEKIKTIGDAYMAAAGLPVTRPDHAERAIRAALQMLDYVADRNRSAAVKWEMRAGIHSGTVIAGVVGKRKFTYDVWGDTVNIASRVEDNGEPGRVCVSAYTYDLVKATFACEYRGKIPLKGKGDIDLYMVTAHH